MIKKLLRFKIPVFTLGSIIGLIILWEPLYLFVSLLSYFLLAIVGHFIGLHRYYSHSSFECNKPMEYFIWLCSFMSGMGEPIGYSQVHIRHHIHSDTPKDLLHPTTHPFMTWIGQGYLYSEYIDHSKVPINKRLICNKFYLFVNKHYIKLYYTFLLLCALCSLNFTLYFLIIGVTLSSHSAHLVNILCHKYGSRNFNTKDYSTNLRWVNWITLGTGLHNNHHAFPYSYTHKIKETEQDLSAWIIKNVLATNVVNVNRKKYDK